MELFCHAIRSVYASMYGAVEVGGYMTTWFAMHCSIRQGDVLAPTVFNVYINDLISVIKNLDCGLMLGETMIYVLIYADDVILISDRPQCIHTMLDALHEWCYKWRMCVNEAKTQVMHFRSNQTPRTNDEFIYNGKPLYIVDHYRYMGLELNEQLDFTHTANTLAAARSRALGGILHKYFKIHGMQFKVFKKLFDTCVIPVLNYGSELWGYKCYQKLETVLHKFLKVYLGLTITAPTAMILGDSGIYPLRIMRKVNIISMFYKLSHLPEDRLLKKVFLYDHGHSLRGTCVF